MGSEMCIRDRDCDGIPDTVETIEGTNPAQKDNDIFGNARLFAMQQYRDFLHREGDPSGIGYWENQLNSGALVRADMVYGFLTSAEFEGRISPVARLYFAYFLRIPDYDGLNYWVGQFSHGGSLVDISQAFAGSAEFQDQYGALDNGQFVTRVYQNVLGREPDTDGLNYWTGQLDSGAMNRGEMMVAFSESAEYQAGIASEISVTIVYMGMLQRAPDQDGFGYWVGQLDAGVSVYNLIQPFLAATEYYHRFLP